MQHSVTPEEYPNGRAHALTFLETRSVRVSSKHGLNETAHRIYIKCHWLAGSTALWAWYVFILFFLSLFYNSCS